MTPKDTYLVENPINRYQLGTYNDLKHHADGSLMLSIQQDNPGKDKESNWLPAAKAPFYITLRLYNPRPKALTLGVASSEARGVQAWRR